MRKLFVVILVNILAGSLGCNAFADMDYRCLNSCVNNGGAAYACNSQCTYALPKTSKNSQLDKYKKGQEQFKNGQLVLKNGQLVTKKDPHKQFSEMYIDYKLMLSTPRTTQVAPEKNYQCVTQCLQGGMAYQMCQEQCITSGTAVR